MNLSTIDFMAGKRPISKIVHTNLVSEWKVDIREELLCSHQPEGWLLPIILTWQSQCRDSALKPVQPTIKIVIQQVKSDLFHVTSGILSMAEILIITISPFCNGKNHWFLVRVFSPLSSHHQTSQYRTEKWSLLQVGAFSLNRGFPNVFTPWRHH